MLAVFWVALFFRAAVNRLLDHFPPQVVRADFSLEERGRSRQGSHDGSKGNEHVVEVPSVRDTLGLVRQLKAAQAHAKVHGVHVNHALIWVTLGRLEARVLVHEEGNLDVNLLFASLSDRLSQAKEPRVRASGHFWDETRSGCLVHH